MKRDYMSLAKVYADKVMQENPELPKSMWLLLSHAYLSGATEMAEASLADEKANNAKLAKLENLASSLKLEQ